MPSVRAGELDQRGTIQRCVQRVTASGDRSPLWNPLATVWMSVQPLTARERAAFGQIGAVQTHRVRIRYRAGLLPADRIIIGSRTLNIESVADVDSRHEYMELLCQELTP